MQIVGSDSPSFYQAAAVMRKYLPYIEFRSDCKIIYVIDRYYGLITKNGQNVIYDHVILDKMVCNPEIIFIVMSTLFQFGTVVNTFIDVDNKVSQRFVQGVGFKHTGILRGQPKDLAIWSMTAAEWATNKIRLHYIKQKPENTSDLA